MVYPLVKFNVRNYYTVDLLVILSIILLIILPYVHGHIPSVDSFTLFEYSIDFKKFPDLRVWVYYILITFTTACLFIIWLLTSERLWTLVLIPVISYNIHQIIFYLYLEVSFFGFYQNLIPWLVGIGNCCLLLILKFKVHYPQKNLNSILNVNDNTLNSLLKKSFNRRKKEKLNYDVCAYNSTNSINSELRKLHRLRAELDLGYSPKPSYYLRTYEIFLAIIVLLSPLIPFLNELFPEGVQSVKIFTLTLGSQDYPDFQTLIWFVGFKLSFLIPLNVWYFTNTHWWKHVLLIPLTLVFSQFISSINVKNNLLDQSELLSSMPILIVLIIFTYWISLKVNEYIKNYEEKELLDYNVNEILKKSALDNMPKKDVLMEYQLLLKESEKMTRKQYLDNLMEIMKKLQE